MAMESTGVYWKSLYYLLEDSFAVLLVNATHMKNVPGPKTDISDYAWIAHLLEHGFLRGTFVPPEPIRERISRGTARRRSRSRKSGFTRRANPSRIVGHGSVGNRSARRCARPGSSSARKALSSRR
jgi:transposase